MESVLAMILAGGRGSRMEVLCETRPKPLLPFAGRYRVIDFTLSNCAHSELKDIAILTDYRRSAMAEYIAAWFMRNGDLGNVSILEPRSNTYSGTADAFYQNMSCIKNSIHDLVLVLAGDHIYKMDYREMIDFHSMKGADVTVGAVRVPIEEAHRFGIVTVDSNSRIVDFVEKPRHPSGNLVSMGIYIFNKKVLMERLMQDAASPESPHDFGHAVIPRMITTDRAFAFEFTGYWRDIGTPKAYYEANMELLLPRPSLSLSGTWPVLGKLPNSPQLENGPHGSLVENSLISSGCSIKGRVVNSILSPGVKVEEKAEVINSIIMADCSVDYHSFVSESILDEDVSVDKFCYLGFTASEVPNGWPVTLLGRGVRVPPYTAVCGNCTIITYAGRQGFPRKILAPDSRLSPAISGTILESGRSEYLANMGI